MKSLFPASARNRWWPVMVAAVWIGFVGCGGEPTSTPAAAPEERVDRSNPRKVVEAVFEAAKTGDASLLQGLCDPRLTTDIDVRRICDYASGFDPEGEFPMFFGTGRIVGERRETADRAEVPFAYGPKGDRLDTMVLAKRDGKWYLEAF